jgi:pyrroloquinoline quinone (PQQ) biosynthesis protein C
MTPNSKATRDIGARRYHRLHPFHALCVARAPGQVQAWALSHYYYQAMIP